MTSGKKTKAASIIMKPPARKASTRRKSPQKKKVVIADTATEAKILLKPKPEFKGQIPIEDHKDGRVVLQNEQLFICDEPGCSAVLTSAASLTRHKGRHVDLRIECEVCSFHFKTNDDKRAHFDDFHWDLKEIPEANILQCKKCKKISTNAFTLRRHIRRTHQHRIYPCPQCGYEYTSMEGLQQHLKRKHLGEGEKKPTYKCEVCNQSYAYGPDLRRHIWRVHRGSAKQLKCVLCNTYYTKDVYRNHMLFHIKPNAFSCAVCNISFRAANRLRDHLKTRRHKDMLEKYQRRRTYKRKCARKTLQGDVIFDLKSVFPDQKTLEELKQMSSQELIQFCQERVPKIILHRVDSQIVGRVSARAEYRSMEDEEENSNDDQEGSNGNTKYYLKCVYCSVEFTTLEDVQTHEISCRTSIRNTKKKIYICTVCDEKFTRHQDFQNHTVKHSDARPYKCHYCEKDFKKKEIRMKHEKSQHFGVQDRRQNKDSVFPCTYEGCDKKYFVNKNLQRHIMSAHKGQEFPCSKCDKVYKRKDYRAIHEAQEHSEEPEFYVECKPCKKVFRHRSLYLSHSKRSRHKKKLLALERGKRGRKKKGKKEETSEEEESPLEKETEDSDGNGETDQDNNQ